VCWSNWRNVCAASHRIRRSLVDHQRIRLGYRWVHAVSDGADSPSDDDGNSARTPQEQLVHTRQLEGPVVQAGLEGIDCVLSPDAFLHAAEVALAALLLLIGTAGVVAARKVAVL